MGGSLWAMKALIASLGGGSHCPSSLGERPKQPAGREGSSHHPGGQSGSCPLLGLLRGRAWLLGNVRWEDILLVSHPRLEALPFSVLGIYFTELETEAQQLAQAHGRLRGDSHTRRSGGLSYVSHHSASKAWLPRREGEPEGSARCEPLFLAQRPPDIICRAPGHWQDEAPAFLGYVRDLGPGVGVLLRDLGYRGRDFLDSACQAVLPLSSHPPLLPTPGQQEGEVGGRQARWAETSREGEEPSAGQKGRSAGRHGAAPAGKGMEGPGNDKGSIPGGLAQANNEPLPPPHPPAGLRRIRRGNL